MNKVIFLHCITKEKMNAVLYLESNIGKTSCLINVFCAPNNSQFRLVLTDEYGNNHYETFSDETRIFCIDKSFSVDGEVLAELFIGDMVMLIGSSEELARDYTVSYKSKEDRLNAYIEKQGKINNESLKLNIGEEKSNIDGGLALRNTDGADREDIVPNTERADKKDVLTNINSIGKEDSFLSQAKYYINLIKEIQSRERKLDESIYKADYVIGKKDEKQEMCEVDFPIVEDGFQQKDTNYSKKSTEGLHEKELNTDAESFQQKDTNYSEKPNSETNLQILERGGSLCQDKLLYVTENDDGNEMKKEHISKKCEKDFIGEFTISKQTSYGFYFKVALAFETLFSAGENERLLSKRFKNSIFRKLRINGDIYVFGKIFLKPTNNLDKCNMKFGTKCDKISPYNSLPQIIIIGRPAINSYSRQNYFGSRSIFISNGEYDEFGFELLMCDVDDGRACFNNSK